MTLITCVVFLLIAWLLSRFCSRAGCAGTECVLSHSPLNCWLRCYDMVFVLRSIVVLRHAGRCSCQCVRSSEDLVLLMYSWCVKCTVNVLFNGSVATQNSIRHIGTWCILVVYNEYIGHLSYTWFNVLLDIVVRATMSRMRFHQAALSSLISELFILGIIIF